MSRVFRALVANDLRLFLADKRAMIATIFVPILLASFFAMIFGSSGDSKKASIPVLVADNDQSTISQKIVAGLKTEGSLVVTAVTAQEARHAVGKGQATVALVIPKDFGTQSASALFNPTAPRPTLVFLYDPAHNADLQLARGLMTQQVMQTVSQAAFSSPSSLGFSAPCTMESEAVVGSNLEGLKDTSGGKAGATHVFIGMGVQGLLFFAIDFAIGMVRDRRQGLWKRLRAAPLSRGMLLGSRWIASSLIGLTVLSVVLAFGAALYGIRVSGSAVGFVLLALASSLMVAAFGLLIAALGRTEGQCRAFAVPAVLTMSFLGGAWIPTFMMPAWVQPISKCLPTRWAVDGFDLVTWRGLGLGEALLPLGVLLGFSLLFAGIAWVRFRWEDG